MHDYLKEYLTEAGFDLPRLFNDDYFQAIKLLFNNKHYVSAMKLLMSSIDTFAFLDFGDVPGNFQMWLNTYADLNSLQVSAEELWEMRNSILHMSNLDSRRVVSGKVRRLTFYIGDFPTEVLRENDVAKFIDMRQLIFCVAQALGKYCQSFNLNKEKLSMFVNRYDSVISDARYEQIKVKG